MGVFLALFLWLPPARGQLHPASRVIVDSWMTSPGHRANLLNPDYTHLGVGVGVLDQEIRATQNFVTRRQ